MGKTAFYGPVHFLIQVFMRIFYLHGEWRIMDKAIQGIFKAFQLCIADLDESFLKLHLISDVPLPRKWK